MIGDGFDRVLARARDGDELAWTVLYDDLSRQLLGYLRGRGAPEPEDQEDRARAALTDLFDDVRTGDTPIIVERVVNDIDEIVRTVRFPGWQTTAQGEREVQKALRRTLLRYKLHNDQDLFDRAYGYIVQYY